MAWKYGDPLTAEDMDAAAKRASLDGKEWLASLFRAVATEKRFNLHRDLMNSRHTRWMVGWVPKGA